MGNMQFWFKTYFIETAIGKQYYKNIIQMPFTVGWVHLTNTPANYAIYEENIKVHKSLYHNM